MSAIIVIRQNRIIAQFANAGATAPESAVTPESLGIRRSFPFRCLVAHGVIVPVDPQRCYLDWEGVARLRRRRYIAALAVVLIGAIILALLVVS